MTTIFKNTQTSLYHENSFTISSSDVFHEHELSYHSDSELEVNMRSRKQHAKQIFDSKVILKSRLSFKIGQYTKTSNNDAEISDAKVLKKSTVATINTTDESENLSEKLSTMLKTEPATPPTQLESSPPQSCLAQARHAEEISVNELAAYFDEIVHLPRKMCRAAESMYA